MVDNERLIALLEAGLLPIEDTEDAPLSCTAESIVGPVMETCEWKRLGACLDVIGENWDNGTHYGFVKADWQRLDRHLAKIEREAKKARKLLRPNAHPHGRVPARTVQGDVGGVS